MLFYFTRYFYYNKCCDFFVMLEYITIIDIFNQRIFSLLYIYFLFGDLKTHLSWSLPFRKFQFRKPMLLRALFIFIVESLGLSVK